ncbi:MAG: hypothetical protein HYS06_06865 [Methylocystis sp.]|nr:hypothetical protein [Methylocystis sp.]
MGYLAPPPSPAPVIVYKDVGGLVADYEAQTEVYRREEREVRLHECRSACTLALSLPNVCVYPDSLLKFHQAYNALTHQVDLGVSAALFTSYPAAVQGRLGDLTRHYKVLKGAELISLGVRNCEDGDRIMIAEKKPPLAPRAGPNPLDEIASSVSAAVASVLARTDEAPKEPIRVAVADRQPVPPAVARLASGADMTKTATLLVQPPSATFASTPKLPGDVKIGAAYGEAPPPPRRPPALALALGQGPAPLAFTQLIRGAHPILSNTRFTSYLAAP